MDKHKLVNTETGEIVLAVVELRRKYFSGGFFMAMQEGFLHLAKLGLTGEQLSVLMYVFGKLDFENWLRIGQQEIADELGMKKPNVSRAMKVLVEKRIIHKGPKVGTSLTYRLDPGFGLKGRAKNEKTIRKDIADMARQRGLQVLQGGKDEDEE
ncbi:MarR family transcriptional regulator [Cohnella endophytica]|uniref:MarR family transcriptional regulator n=1 Tax=Cohnella endophytica TaxID=2419778 RepID=A0A494X6A6_9BACL|nr:helix-turn-helix domain-containing protein [Cohnella endophytica]RKP43776.1 MarR family transcriptional regulator [Cohnella endophytica]